jgi:hypothetical protein
MNTTQKLMLSPNSLKVIAILCMVLDHCPLIFGTEFFQSTYYHFMPGILHAFGRISAPIFFFFVAEGYARTRNVNFYALRLLLFGLISYAPYMMCRYNSLFDLKYAHCQNIMFTLLFGLLFLRVIDEIGDKMLRTMLAFALGVLISFCDYGVMGLAHILVFHKLRGRDNQAVIFAAFSGISLTYLHRVLNFTRYSSGNLLDRFFTPDNLMSICQVLCIFIAICLILRCDFEIGNSRTRISKWFFYCFYPLHLLVIVLLRIYVVGFPLR